MARINFVFPPLQADKFGGGLWCIKEYADGLARRGHDVQVLPMLPSPVPSWFGAAPPFKYLGTTLWKQVKNLTFSSGRLFIAASRYLLRRIDISAFREAIHDWTSHLVWLYPYVWPFEIFRAASLRYVRMNMREAEVTIATSFETALSVKFYGTGEKFYFMQHFEPYFCNEKAGGEISRLEALCSYHLGLEMVANSTWLQRQIINEVPDIKVKLCWNAINHEYFYGQVKVPICPETVKVISYGGRGVAWKGFRDMAESIRLVRDSCPDIKIVWQVYGEAELPADNPIAPYEPLVFLQPPQLANAYRQADILLSASWYESFPLFPLEAMACGLAVVTTQLGTEDFAIAGKTAQVVEARNVASIAEGLALLIREPAYRERIARAGQVISQKFTWPVAVERFEKILFPGRVFPGDSSEGLL